MASTVRTVEYTGTTTTNTMAAIQYGTADSTAPGSTYPQKVPASGTNYSYWKSLALWAETAPTTQIQNVKIYSDGTLWTNVNTLVSTTTGYTQATGTQGTTGAQYTIVTGTNFNAYTTGNMYAVGGTIGAATGKISNYVVLQNQITTSAAPGATAVAETYTWSYDES